jgi:hypothetical protein
MTTRYWITGTSGDWSTAADWLSGVVPSSTDDVVINNTYGTSNMTVDGTAVAHSLTLNSSELTVSGSLTLGTSLTLNSGSQGAELALAGGTLSAQSITGGEIIGYGTVSSGAVSSSAIYATGGGTLKVEGFLAGSGPFLYPRSGRYP